MAPAGAGGDIGSDVVARGHDAGLCKPSTHASSETKAEWKDTSC